MELHCFAAEHSLWLAGPTSLNCFVLAVLAGEQVLGHRTGVAGRIEAAVVEELAERI
jgi:hypothetical protein